MADHKPRGAEESRMRWLTRFWKPIAWLVSIILVGYVFAITPFRGIAEILRQLSVIQIGLLLVVNAAIITLFGLRWWLLLRSQGHHLPYLAIMRYRLAAFGVSYFTPGPQFGGEPLQVYYLRKYHDLPTVDILASLSLDKLFELMANFTFLAVGIVYVFVGGYLDIDENLPMLPPILILTALPWGYLVLLYFGVKPLSWMSSRIAAMRSSNAQIQTISTTIERAETQTADFCRSKFIIVVGLMLLSGLVWLALICEYWLALRFLGVEISLGNTLVFITAARLAFLMPLPGGLGSLEISQVLAAGALGFGSEFGASVGLLIRLRDITFGLLGLIWGGILTCKF